MPNLSRRPPKDVLEILRREVGFCCPIDDCGKPYLTWHHFDPPWRIENHHRPEGMIALCHIHADQADNGTFTDDQLRNLKRTGRRSSLVHGRFNWLRRELLAVVGGSFYYEQPTILQIGAVKCIWFNRDDEGYLLLNFRMPSLTHRSRASIEDNIWTVRPDASRVACPPSGRIVEVSYDNGDHFKAEFFTVSSPAKLLKRYPNRGIGNWISNVIFPLTLVELTETAAGTSISLDPQSTQIGNVTITNYFSARNGGAGIHIDVPRDQLAQLFPAEIIEELE